MTADWQIVLLLSFAIIGAIAVFLIAYAFFTVFFFLAVIFRQYTDDRRSLVVQFIGLIWHILYYGLTIGALFTAVGIAQAYISQGTYDTLNRGLIILCSTNGVLMIYTLIVWKPLAQFIKEYSVNLEQEATDVPKKSKITFEVEKKSSYFVMLSSTYFLPLNHELLAKNKKNLERVKKFMSMFKLANNSPKSRKKPQDDITNNPISIQTLHEYKEKLDLTIERISSKINPFQVDDTTIKSPKNFRIQSARFPDPPLMTNKESALTDLKIGRSNSKLNLSADDMENLQRIDLSPQQEQSDGDENLCYVCYERVADAVLMNCGHGGICYECAIASNKVKNECVECRAPVVAIHKVDPNLKMVDVIKSLECSKIVVEMEP